MRINSCSFSSWKRVHLQLHSIMCTRRWWFGFTSRFCCLRVNLGNLSEWILMLLKCAAVVLWFSVEHSVEWITIVGVTLVSLVIVVASWFFVRAGEQEVKTVHHSVISSMQHKLYDSHFSCSPGKPSFPFSHGSWSQHFCSAASSSLTGRATVTARIGSSVTTRRYAIVILRGNSAQLCIFAMHW